MNTTHKRRIKYLVYILATAFLIVLMALVSAMSTVSPAVAQVATCTDCHNDTTLITGKKIQWEESLHGTGEAYLRGTSASCAGCHSGGGFSAMVAAGQQPNQVTVGDPNPTRQDCRACHQIHTSNTSADWALEIIAPVNLYAFTGMTFDGGSGNLCAKCHQPRTKAPVAVNGVVTGITSRYGPHHGPQSSMMLGTGGAGIEGTSTAHYSSVADTCVGCHMGTTSSHTNEPNVTTCKVCHTTATNFDINGVQTETQAKLDQLGNLLVAAGVLSSIDPAESHPTVTSAPENVAYALYNWIFIGKEDGSKGVHNPVYTATLLDASIAALELPFSAKWDALGGAPGADMGAVTPITGGGMYKDYVNGRLIWKQSTNTVYWVHGAILIKYGQLGRETGALGLPIGDEMDVSGVTGARVSNFANGRIYWSPGVGTFAMTNQEIIDKYDAPPPGMGTGPEYFGLPTSDVYTAYDGHAQNMQKAIFTTNLDLHAHYVRGGVMVKYQMMGGPTGALRLIISEEAPISGVPGAPEAVQAAFQNGQVYWSLTTGSHTVNGGIYTKYMEVGGPTGRLGLPITDEYPLALPGGAARSQFQHGFITWGALYGTWVDYR